MKWLTALLTGILGALILALIRPDKTKYEYLITGGLCLLMLIAHDYIWERIERSKNQE